MRIIYLHQYFTTPSHAGGVRSYEFAKRLVERGVAVDMVTSSAFLPTPKKKGERFVSRRSIDNIDVHVIHTAYSNSMSFQRRILAFVTFTIIASLYVIKLKKRNLVFATSTPLTIAIPGLIAKAVHRIPMIFEVRDVWPDIPIAMGIIKNKYLKKALYTLEGFIYSRSDKIVTLSIGMEEEIKKKNVPCEKVLTIPNACDVSYFEELENQQLPDILQEYKNENAAKICIYAGTFGLVNNLDYILDLCSEIKKKDLNIIFLLIGSGSQQQHIARRIKSEQLEGQVTILPPVPKKILLRYLESANACISTVQSTPALYNNSANKFFDALAAGRPIVINHGGWQAEIITNNDLGLVLDYDFPTSAERLSAYLHDFDRTTKAQEIRAYAKSHFDRDALFETLYRDGIKPLLTPKQ